MKIAIFGLGYVGFTAMCCIAHEGHAVVGFDVSEKKVSQINSGLPPIYEPEVEEMLNKGLNSGLIHAYTEIGEKLNGVDVAIVCVGTPSASDGSHNMTYIAEVSRQIAEAVDRTRRVPLTVAYRSTMRPGTIEQLISPIFRDVLGGDFDTSIDLVYNPEFLRESTAVKDYFEPPKIVIGTKDGKPNARMELLNQNIKAPTFYVGYGEAEMTKFVDNTWHAVKVAYANEIGRVCLQLGLSASKISEIFLSDTKLNISRYYMQPGGAFGGSCLPKDTRALQHISTDIGSGAHIIDNVIRSNEAHKHFLFTWATDGLPKSAKVLLVGLAFKADSDDLRESPSVNLARKLLMAGYDVTIWDSALEPSKLIGQNFGYGVSQLPSMSSLLVDKATAESRTYDRVIDTNGRSGQLQLTADVIRVHSLP